MAMVLTPVASAQALAGLCSMTGIDCHVVPSSSGAVAVIELDDKGRAVDDPTAAKAQTGDAAALAAADVPAADDDDAPARADDAPAAADGDADDDLHVRDWDISELLGGSPEDIPPQADELAKNLSRLSKTGVVLITAALTEGGGFERGLSGQLTGRHYSGGEAGEKVAVGLILAGADDMVEDLILRRVRVAEVSGHQRSGSIPRWKAARMFGKGLRRRKP
ncbi:hypothetical protein V2J52_15585 [Georgenia sp. MJ173]|uniref:hypothetical protein n=1 Tax=Georgenia sunbinii TaxID=3117728 RepID=UPI002F26C1A6